MNTNLLKARYLMTGFLLLVLTVSCAPRSGPAQAASSKRNTTSPPASTPSTFAAVTPDKPHRSRQDSEQPPFGASTPTTSNFLVKSDFNLILGRPTADTIDLSVYSLSDRQVRVTYGLASGSDRTQTAPVLLRGGSPQTIELTGLAADSAYTYRVIAGGVDPAEHTFYTQRAPGSTFTFTIDTDLHSRDLRFDGPLYATTLSNARRDQPDFHINLGDTFMTEKLHPQTYAEAESTFTDLRPYFGIIGPDAPLFLVNGNHEGELGWLLSGRDQDLPVWSTRLRQQYYPNPTPGGFYTGSSTPDPVVGIRDGYYSWIWGDALFVVLDPFWYTTAKPRPEDPDSSWNWTLGKAQYDWLKTTLETSQARYKFIFIHHLVGGLGKDARGGIEAAPNFEWGGNNADGSYGFDAHRPGWGKPIHQLLVENYASAVFHGHDHVFVKQELDGIVYQELPQPSNREYNKTSMATDYGYTHGDVLGSSGYLSVTVAPTQVAVEYVRSYLPQDEKPGQQNGQVDYRYTLSPFLHK